MNVWLTLSDCGEDAPGLDIFPRRLDHLVETGTKGAVAWWTVGEGLLEEMTQTVPMLRRCSRLAMRCCLINSSCIVLAYARG